MKSITVKLDDGTQYVTSINPECSMEEVIQYFVGKWFNYGVERDLMIKCVAIEIKGGF